MRLYELARFEEEHPVLEKDLTARYPNTIVKWGLLNAIPLLSLALFAIEGWWIAAACLTALTTAANVGVYRTNRDWLCCLTNSALIVRVIAPPGLFKRTRDAISLTGIAEFTFGDISWIDSEEVEIWTQDGSIPSRWLVFELQAETSKKIIDFCKETSRERLNANRPVYFELRTDDGKCYLRWDDVTPSAADYLDRIHTKSGVAESPGKLSKRVVDVRQLSHQPEPERSSKVVFLTNLGFGPLVIRLLTERQGMTLKDATAYMDGIFGREGNNPASAAGRSA